MKANAITRIIIWSIVIVLLSGILLAGLGWNTFTVRRTETAATVVAVPITEPTAPDPGTIPSPTVSAAPAAPAETTPVETTPSVPVNGDALQFAAGGVSEIKIEWAAGSILVTAADVDAIVVSEEGADSSKPLTWKQKGQKLTISFSESSGHGFGISATHKKDLTIQVPRDWVCQELDINAGAAILDVQNLTIQEVEIEAGSGKCNFVNCTVGSMDVESASGDVTFSGSLNSLECEAVSANFEGILSNVPRNIEMESTSGNLNLTLPETAGFSVRMEGLSKKFQSDFQTTSQNGRYVHGDGFCRIEVEAVSGSVTIHKSSSIPTASTGNTASATGCPCPNHVHTEACRQAGSTCPAPNHVHTETCHSGGAHHRWGKE